MNFDRLGTAQWADAEDIAKKYPHGPGKFWLGRTLPGNAPIGTIDDRHICVVAGTRSGKGTSVLIPNLQQWPGSAVIVDPTGDTATITAGYRSEELGQKVFVLDPYHESDVDDALRAQFNPLDMLDPDSRTVVRDAERIASALVSPDENEEAWAQNGARRLIAALVLYVVAAPIFEGRRNLVTVRELVYRGDTKLRDHLHEMGKAKEASAFDVLWGGMSATEHSNIEICEIIAGAGEEFARMGKMAPPQWTGVHDAALSATNFINNRDMKECLSRSDFDMSSLKTDPDGVSIYLTVPSRDKVEDFRWLRLIISQLMSQLETLKSPPRTGHDVLFILDEFAGLQKMDRLEAGIAEIAKYGVKLCIVLQNLGQLRRVYKEGWETFLANCGTKVFFGVDDKFTREYVSELIGETEIIRSTGTTSEGTSSSSNQTNTSGTSKSEQETRSTSKSDSYRRGKFNLRDTVGFFRKLSGNATASDTTQSGSTVGEATEESTSEGTSSSKERSSTKAEQIFKRPLITPDEVGKLFQRIDDKDHALYPGAAIIISSDYPDPMMLRRQNYFDEMAEDMDSSSAEDERQRPGASSDGRGDSEHPFSRNNNVMKPTKGYSYPYDTDPQHLEFAAKVRFTDIHKDGPTWASDYVLDARFIPVASIFDPPKATTKTPRKILEPTKNNAQTSPLLEWHRKVVSDADNYYQRKCTIQMRVSGQIDELWNFLTNYSLRVALSNRATSEDLLRDMVPNEEVCVGDIVQTNYVSSRSSFEAILKLEKSRSSFSFVFSSPLDSDKDYEMFGWREISAEQASENEILVSYSRLNYKRKRLHSYFRDRNFLGYALTPGSVYSQAAKFALDYHCYRQFGPDNFQNSLSSVSSGVYRCADGFEYRIFDEWVHADEDVTIDFYPDVLLGEVFTEPVRFEAFAPIWFCNYRDNSIAYNQKEFSRSTFSEYEIVAQYVPNGARLPIFNFATPVLLGRRKIES